MFFTIPYCRIVLQYLIINNECAEKEIEHIRALNPFWPAIEDINRETVGFRVGRRIRTIRFEEDLSQRELGDKAGLMRIGFSRMITARES